MKYKKFHKLIEESNAEQKQATYQSLQEELNLPEVTAPAQKTAGKLRNFFKKPARLVACLSAAVVAVCLAIVLPVTLNNSGGTPTPPAPPTPSDRYTSGRDCRMIELDCTLKEYAMQNGLTMLYVDWYDIADNVNTAMYVNPDDHDDVYYLSEHITDGETGVVVMLYITDLFTRIDSFDRFLQLGNQVTITNGVSIHWYWNDNHSGAYFEYGDYRYFVELMYPFAEDSILEIVQSMLPL